MQLQISQHPVPHSGRDLPHFAKQASYKILGSSNSLPASATGSAHRTNRTFSTGLACLKLRFVPSPLLHYPISFSAACWFAHCRNGQLKPNVPLQYQPLFYQFADWSPSYEQAAKPFGLTGLQGGSRGYLHELEADRSSGRRASAASDASIVLVRMGRMPQVLREPALA